MPNIKLFMILVLNNLPQISFEITALLVSLGRLALPHLIGSNFTSMLL